MKKQKTWTVVLMVVIGVISALTSKSLLGLVFTSIYALWVAGMMMFWVEEGKLEIINKIKE